MKNLKIEDLVKGKIYYTINPSNNKYIFKSRESKTSKYSDRLISDRSFNKNDYFGTGGIIERNLRKATLEEKHWLNCCIKENEFVPYEKAMETFNNETFAIEINSQEELNACMEYYKNLGYKENGDSHIYNREFNWVKIDTKCKTWQTVFKHNINGFPVKTLKELGINQQNTQQYEVGRWYKYMSPHLKKDCWYVKYSNLQPVFDRFYYDEVICLDKSIASHKYGYTKKHDYSIFSCNPVLLTDLEIIQQYLPEFHPDKLVKQELKQPSYKYEVVHCETQEQWNFVTKKLNYEWQRGWNILKQTDGYCINVKQATHGSLTWYKDNNSLIYSFNEWCNKFGHSPDFMNKKQEIPEYLEVLQRFFCEKDQIGKIYKTTEAFPIHLKYCQKLNWEEAYLKNQSCFKSSTKEAYEAQFLLTKGIQYEKVSDNYTSNYITGVNPYQNETIEIGDFVNWTNSGTFDKKDFLGYEVWKISKNNFWIIYNCKKEEYQNYPLNIQGLKIIKKAKNNTTHVNKKVDISSPIQVGNEVTNITIPKSASVVLKNTENEVKIKINLKQTIKL